MPALWGYPLCPIITHTIDSYWISTQKQDKVNITNLNNLEINHFFQFGKNLLHNTPPAVAW